MLFGSSGVGAGGGRAAMGKWTGARGVEAPGSVVDGRSGSARPAAESRCEVRVRRADQPVDGRVRSSVGCARGGSSWRGVQHGGALGSGRARRSMVAALQWAQRLRSGPPSVRTRSMRASASSPSSAWSAGTSPGLVDGAGTPRLAEALRAFGAEQVEGAGELALTGVGQVDVDRRRLDARVAEQQLHGAAPCQSFP